MVPSCQAARGSEIGGSAGLPIRPRYRAQAQIVRQARDELIHRVRSIGNVLLQRRQALEAARWRCRAVNLADSREQHSRDVMGTHRRINDAQIAQSVSGVRTQMRRQRTGLDCNPEFTRREQAALRGREL